MFGMQSLLVFKDAAVTTDGNTFGVFFFRRFFSDAFIIETMLRRSVGFELFIRMLYEV
jgi:hypothetical protein